MGRVEIHAILMIIELISLNIINGCECCCTSCKKRKATNRYIYIGGNSTTDNNKSKNSTNNDYSSQNSQHSKPEKEETDKSSDKITNNAEGKEKLLNYIKEKEISSNQNNITKEKINETKNTDTSTDNTDQNIDKDNLENNENENNLQDNDEKNNEPLNNPNVDLNTKNDNTNKTINKENEKVNKLEENENENENNSYDLDTFIDICVMGPKEREEQNKKDKEERAKERQEQLERLTKEIEENKRIEKEEMKRESENKERQKQLEREMKKKEEEKHKQFLERLDKESKEYERKIKEETERRRKENEKALRECKLYKKQVLHGYTLRLSQVTSMTMEEKIDKLNKTITDDYQDLDKEVIEQMFKDLNNLSRIENNDPLNISFEFTHKELEALNNLYNKNIAEALERENREKAEEEIRIAEKEFDEVCKKKEDLVTKYKEKSVDELSPKFIQKDNASEPRIIFENAEQKKTDEQWERFENSLYFNYATNHCSEIYYSDKEYHEIFNTNKIKAISNTQIFQLSDVFYNKIIDHNRFEIIQLASTEGKTGKEKEDTLNESNLLIGSHQDSRPVIGLYYPDKTSLIALIELKTERKQNKFNKEKGYQEEYNKYLLFFHGGKDCSKYFMNSKIKNIKIIHRTFTNADDMFYGCKDLKNITFEDYNINTQVKEFNKNNKAYPTFVTAKYMFKNCTNLKEVSIKFSDVLIGENTTDVTEMFSGCTNLGKIDNFASDTLNPQIDMRALFNDCANLKNIEGFKIPYNIATKNIDQMFYRCKNLSEYFIKNIPDNIKGITGLTKNANKSKPSSINKHINKKNFVQYKYH